jgi:hypothetical protein
MRTVALQKKRIFQHQQFESLTKLDGSETGMVRMTSDVTEPKRPTSPTTTTRTVDIFWKLFPSFIFKQTVFHQLPANSNPLRKRSFVKLMANLICSLHLRQSSMPTFCSRPQETLWRSFRGLIRDAPQLVGEKPTLYK